MAQERQERLSGRKLRRIRHSNDERAELRDQSPHRRAAEECCRPGTGTDGGTTYALGRGMPGGGAAHGDQEHLVRMQYQG